MKLSLILVSLQLIIILCMAFYTPASKTAFVLTPVAEPTISPLATPFATPYHCLFFPIAGE